MCLVGKNFGRGGSVRGGGEGEGFHVKYTTSE